jgi:hypothetical protein
MMKKVILTIAILVVPFLMTAQNSDKNAKTEINTTINTEIQVTAKKKTERISTNPLEQTLMNFKKSHDIISVNAYIKSLQIKGDVALNS